MSRMYRLILQSSILITLTQLFFSGASYPAVYLSEGSVGFTQLSSKKTVKIETLNEVIAHLKGSDSQKKYQAIMALSEFGKAAAPAIPVLIEALHSVDSNGYLATFISLSRIGPPAIPSLLSIINSKKHLTVEAGTYVISSIEEQGEDLLKVIWIATADTDSATRANAAWALGKIGVEAKDAVSSVKTGLKHKSYMIRRNCARALGEISPTEDTVEELVPLLSDQNGKVKRVAAITLGNIGPVAKDAVPAIIKLLKDSDLNVRVSAVYALGKIGNVSKQVVPAFIDTLENAEHEYIKALCSFFLGEIGPAAKDAVPALIKALDTGACKNAAEALGKIGPSARSAIELLGKKVAENGDCSEDADKAIKLITKPK